MKIKFFDQPYLIRLIDLGNIPNLPFATRAYNIDRKLHTADSMQQIIIIKDLWRT
jgi:hypothetical protein